MVTSPSVSNNDNRKLLYIVENSSLMILDTVVLSGDARVVQLWGEGLVITEGKAT